MPLTKVEAKSKEIDKAVAELLKELKEEEMPITKQEEIREGFKDFICRLAKSDEWDACKNCEKLDLKPVCSIRHNGDEYLTYLHSQGCVLKVGREIKTRSQKIEHTKYYTEGIADTLQSGYVAVEPLIEEEK